MNGKLQLPPEITLVGKGPSFKKDLDWSTFPPFFVCVNETVLLVDWAQACVAIDGLVAPVFEEVSRERNVLVIHPWENRSFPFQYRFQPILIQKYWTGAQALWVLAELGVKQIHSIGFDSFSGMPTLDQEKRVKGEDGVETVTTEQVFSRFPPHWYSQDVLDLGLPYTKSVHPETYQKCVLQMTDVLRQTGIEFMLRHTDMNEPVAWTETEIA